jgi:hypothetical protein
LILDKGILRSEIEKWDLQDIRDAYEMIDMKNDYEAASNMQEASKIKFED